MSECAAHAEPKPVKDGAVIVRKYRFKSSARLTRYARGMQEEYDWLVNAGVETAHSVKGRHPERAAYALICSPRGNDIIFQHDSVDGQTRRAYAGTPRMKNHRGVKAAVTIPIMFAHGAIKDGVGRVSTKGSFRPCTSRGAKMTSILSPMPLGGRSKDDVVHLPGAGKLFSLREPLHDDIGRMTMYRIVDATQPWESPADSERKFELHVTYKRDIIPHMGTGVRAGIDPGGTYTAAVTYMRDGEVIGCQLVKMDFGPERQKIRNLHRQRSRCAKGSRRYGELTRQIQKTYKKINRRWLHQAYQQRNHIIHNADIIYCEGANLAKMTAKCGRRARARNRIMRDARPGEFRDMVCKGAQRDGRQYHEVQPEDTSKRHYQCKGYETTRRGARLRCIPCGAEEHADLNAGANIASGDFDIITWSQRARKAADLEAALQESRDRAIHDMGAVPVPDGPTPEGGPHDNHAGPPRHPALNACQPEVPHVLASHAGGSHTPSKDTTKIQFEMPRYGIPPPDISQAATHARGNAARSTPVGGERGHRARAVAPGECDGVEGKTSMS